MMGVAQYSRRSQIASLLSSGDENAPDRSGAYNGVVLFRDACDDAGAAQNALARILPF